MRVLPAILYFLAGIVVYPLLFKLLGGAGGSVLFYRGLVYAAVVLAIQLVGTLLHSRGRMLPGHEAVRTTFCVAVCALSLSFNVVFLIVFPVTFDRSVTMFLLEDLDRNGPMTQKQMESSFIGRYVVDERAIARRVTEQKLGGTVTTSGEAVSLTSAGRALLRFSEAVRAVYGTSDPAIVHGIGGE